MEHIDNLTKVLFRAVIAGKLNEESSDPTSVYVSWASNFNLVREGYRAMCPDTKIGEYEKKHADDLLYVICKRIVTDFMNGPHRLCEMGDWDASILVYAKDYFYSPWLCISNAAK